MTSLIDPLDSGCVGMKFRPIQRMTVFQDRDGNERKLGSVAWSGAGAGHTLSTREPFYLRLSRSHARLGDDAADYNRGVPRRLCWPA